MSVNSKSNASNNGGVIFITSGAGTPVITVNYPDFSNSWFDVSTSSKKKDDRDGCDCVKCKEFYPMSEPNQENGTLICYKCRHGW